MKPRTQTTFRQLEIGDRFCPSSNKDVWIKINNNEAEADIKTLTSLYPKKIEKDRIVVFLRKSEITEQ